MLLIQMACGLVFLVGGLILLVGGLTARPRDGVRVGAGALVLALLAVPVASEWRHHSAVDAFEWNPGIEGDPVVRSRVVGTWAAGPSRLVLRPDGTFRLALEDDVADRVRMRTAEGTWALNNWSVVLTANGGRGGRGLQVVRAKEDGSYRIVEGAAGDESWVPWAGFSRLSPSDG
jgi:hypothetical protein